MTGKLPVAIIIPHAGRQIPPEVAGRVALTDAQIFNEADAYADLLYDFRGQVQRWLCFPWARAIIDVNRPADDAANRPGDGIVKQRTSYGAPVYLPGQSPDDALAQTLVARYWQPWHDQLAAIAADPAVRLVIDAHTMAAFGPSLYDDPAQPRPRLTLANWGGANGAPTATFPSPTAPAALLQAWAEKLGALLADLPALAPTGPRAALNTPFYGGADLRLHGGQRQPWLMIEISRALYVGEQTGDTPVTPPDEARMMMIRSRLWQGFSELIQSQE